MRLSEFDTGEIVVDQSEIAKKLGVHRQQINQTLKEFVALGLLEFVGKRSRHNVYRLPERIVWKGRPEKRMKLIAGGLEKATALPETSADNGEATMPNEDEMPALSTSHRRKPKQKRDSKNDHRQETHHS